MKVLLCSGWDSLPTQLVYGELVNLAWPILQSYRSDLYHDAQWLEGNLQVGVPFYYGIRSTGTDLAFHNLGGSRNTWYRCELTLNDIGSHYLTITEES